VTITAGEDCEGCNLATITGKAWLLVKPELYEGIRVSPQDPAPATLSDVYMTTLDVYRRTTETDGQTTDDAQAVLLWEAGPCPAWACAASGSSTDPASVGRTIARAGIRDSRTGLVIPAQAVYDATAGTWSGAGCLATCVRLPDRVTVRYLAGYPAQPDGSMNRSLAVAVSRLAMAEMTRPLCACDSANQQFHYWNSVPEGDEYNPADLDNPFGPRRGHIDAWKRARSLRVLPGAWAG
jgi:hypothetical protein